MARAVTKVERGIVELFLKTVGAETGLYRYNERVFVDGFESEGLYQENLRQVRACLTGGWVAADLSAFIRSRYKAGDRAALLSKILSHHTRQKLLSLEDELLETDAAYQHPRLFVTRGPRLKLVGEQLEKVEGGERQRRESFTLGELVTLFLTTCPFADPERARQLGPWNWLLDQASLDEVLTAIEQAGEVPDTAQTIFSLANFLPAARTELKLRAGRATEQGVPHE